MTIAVTAPTASPATPASTQKPAGALASLTGNFTDFLSLLMTQLKNQDPTSPMDTNAFTSQLVQYASVEQQIGANSNLTKLIQATQSNTVLQASALVGKDVLVTNDHLSLQGSTAQIHFTSPSAEPVNIGIYSDTGTKILTTTVQAQAGNNNWTWDGRNADGTPMPDGAYKLVVNEPSGAALATTITGRVTGLQRTAETVSISLGALNTDVGSIQSIANGT